MKLCLLPLCHNAGLVKKNTWNMVLLFTMRLKLQEEIPTPTPTFSQTLTVALKNEMKFEFNDIHPDILDYPLS